MSLYDALGVLSLANHEKSPSLINQLKCKHYHIEKELPENSFFTKVSFLDMISYYGKTFLKIQKFLAKKLLLQIC